MKRVRAALGLVLIPPVALYGWAVAAVTLVLDLIATPVVGMLRARQRPAPEPPAHNASVIVLNYNRAAYLRAILPPLQEAVDATPGDHEIIVVDNGSEDESCDVVRAHEGVRLVELDTNRYFIRGNRAGVEAATRDILVFVNNDMRVERDFLRRLLARFGANDVFAVTARIEMDGTRFETGLTRAEFRAGAIHQVQVQHQATDLVPAMWAGGGSSAFDRAKYLALGGFEDLYHPCYVEDMSLSYQAWRRGWRVLYEPGAIAHHGFQGTTVSVLGRQRVRRLDRRNRELLFWRSVTAPDMVLRRALLLPWNLLKDRAQLSARDQAAALLATLPRLPRAWWARTRSRIHHARSDREVLRVANHVSRHRRTIDPRLRQPLRILSVGCDEPEPTPAPDDTVWIEHTIPLTSRAEPPTQDVFGLVPRRYWGATGDVLATERVRDALRETDYDAVVFRDPWALACAPRPLIDESCLLVLPALDEPEASLENMRELHFWRGLTARLGGVLCAREREAKTIAALRPRLRCAVGAPDDREAVAALCRAAAEESA